MKNRFLKDKVCVIETNIDDMSPLVYETLFEKLYKYGALEVFLTPVYMKKMRPGVLLSALCPKDNFEDIVELIFRETTTFGIRYYETERLKLVRKKGQYKGKWGKISVNKGYIGKELVKVSPEYDSCRGIANKKKAPIKDVISI